MLESKICGGRENCGSGCHAKTIQCLLPHQISEIIKQTSSQRSFHSRNTNYSLRRQWHRGSDDLFPSLVTHSVHSFILYNIDSHCHAGVGLTLASTSNSFLPTSHRTHATWHWLEYKEKKLGLSLRSQPTYNTRQSRRNKPTSNKWWTTRQRG